jgi:hypothetical protein
LKRTTPEAAPPPSLEGAEAGGSKPARFGSDGPRDGRVSRPRGLRGTPAARQSRLRGVLSTLSGCCTCVLATCSIAAAAADLVSPIGTGPTPAAPWRSRGLPQQRPAPTRFEVVAENDGTRVLRIEADRAYGTLVHPLSGVRAGTLAWRWRVDRPVDGADLRRKSGDDAALKVCALFDMPLARVPFVERQLLRLASARAGEALPTATLCYVWEPALPSGSLLHNAYTRRVRFITARHAAGAWTTEQHDLARDFRRAFGEESDEVPPLTALLIGADTDNTGSHSLAWLDGLRLLP